MKLNPITWAMLADEMAAGRRAILPDEVPAWLRVGDWNGWPVLSIDDERREVHIVALYAARPGAFRALVAGIVEAGLTPVVVAPFALMVAIVHRWGWQRSTVGEGWTAREEWRPGPLGWRGGLPPRPAVYVA